MRVTTLLESNSCQVVLTPENDEECKQLDSLGVLGPGVERVSVYHGVGFYKCQGGWVREHNGGYESRALIFRLEKHNESR